VNHLHTNFLLFFPLPIYSASDHAFKGILTCLPKPGGGEFGKFYSLPALNDPRIGMYVKFYFILLLLFFSTDIYIS
jgi:hypothetical protein